MNLIFLDVDGVLNSREYFDSLKGFTRGEELDESKIILLKQIVDECDAKIVFSSTWRTLNDSECPEAYAIYTKLINTLQKHDLSIMSSTPVIRNDRPLEIKTWLDTQSDKDSIRFVSLDDDFKLEYYEVHGLGHCLVHTCFWGENGGLQPCHVEEAIKILIGEK